MSTFQIIDRELRDLADPEKREFLPEFFQAYPGGYGEGDRFLGITVPNQRTVAKKYAVQVSDKDLTRLIQSKIHEHRLTGLYILIHRFEKALKQKEENLQKQIVNYYTENLDYVNNWDLVDSSAYKILGPYYLNRNRKPLDKLAKSGHLWRERVAVITTMHFISKGDFDDTFRYAKQFLNHKHDLMHKATGWMLREAGKKDETRLLAFLREHHSQMPRTMLRYSIERIQEPLRKKILKGEAF